MSLNQMTLDDAIAAAETLRDEGMARTEAADDRHNDGRDKQLIDAEIDRLCAAARVWSANDLREHLPHVRQPLIGARVRAAAKAKRIRHVGYTPSSLPSTHAHDIKTWIGAA